MPCSCGRGHQRRRKEIRRGRLNLDAFVHFQGDKVKAQGYSREKTCILQTLHTNSHGHDMIKLPLLNSSSTKRPAEERKKTQKRKHCLICSPATASYQCARGMDRNTHRIASRTQQVVITKLYMAEDKGKQRQTGSGSVTFSRQPTKNNSGEV